MVYIVGMYYAIEAEGNDIEHMDEIYEAWQAIIEGFVDDNGLGETYAKTNL